MTCCGHCRDAGDLFTDRTARRELRRYRKKGPTRTTRTLLDAIRPRLGDRWTLLDVGGGIGAIQHELLDAGVVRATQVDASAAYLEASRREAERLGHADQVEQVYGDFAAMAESVPDADVVTLDRVICCYPHMEVLVEASAKKARHVYGLVYPREHLAMRAFLAAANLYMGLRRSAFRTFMHRGEAVDALVRSLGFERASHETTLLWQVVMYTRR
jgi:2-polyprenyl-3-methyl-5-hydroxy-6-metoxy-1,4-benzoquinol methylase